MARSREVDLPGMYNVRDLGGLPLGTGGATNFGVFLRAESPHLLDRPGWETLYGHGLRTVVDLRSEFERVEDPYEAMVADIEVRPGPLEEGLLDDAEFRAWAESGILSCALYFRPFLERWPDRVAATFRVLAAVDEGAVVFHCQRGRDRTGLVALLLLSLAGVPDEVVIADHLLTDERLEASGLALGHVPLDGEAALFASAGTTAELTLSSLLRDLDVESYLLDVGLSRRDVDWLRHRLTASA